MWALLASLSVGLSFAGYIGVRELYRRELSVRLDPTSSELMETRRLAEADRAGPGPKVVFFGDSRIEQWPVPTIEGAESFNRGRGGETSAQALLRLDRDVLFLQPSIVVIQICVNDLKAIGVLPNSYDAIIRRCTRNLTEMVERLTAADVVVVLTPVFPIGPVNLARRLVWSDATLDAVTAINTEIRQLAGRSVHVVDTDPLLSEAGRMKSEFAEDTLHVNLRGYAELSKLFQHELPPLLAQTGSE